MHAESVELSPAQLETLLLSRAPLELSLIHILRDGRIHIDEVYSAKRDAYYPADLILKDDGERVIYWLCLLYTSRCV